MSDLENRPLALWLLPRAEDGLRLRRLIGALARKFVTPEFEPHLTLASGTVSSSTEDIERAVVTRFTDFRPRTVGVTGAGGTGDRFTAFYLACSESELDPDLRSAQACAPNLRGPRVGPHLSLLYREGLTDEDRRSIRDSLAHEIPERIVFDRIASAWPERGEWSDVASWRTKPIVG